jgi:hypothetical protein
MWAPCACVRHRPVLNLDAMPPIESGFMGLLCYRALEIRDRLLDFPEMGRAASFSRAYFLAQTRWPAHHGWPELVGFAQHPGCKCTPETGCSCF